MTQISTLPISTLPISILQMSQPQMSQLSMTHPVFARRGGLPMTAGRRAARTNPAAQQHPEPSRHDC
jgi:hypothetical protein